MAKARPHIARLVGALGPVQLQGCIQRTGDDLMLRARQTRKAPASAAEIHQREQFAIATSMANTAKQLVDLSLFDHSISKQPGYQVLRSAILRSIGWPSPPWPVETIDTGPGPRFPLYAAYNGQTPLQARFLVPWIGRPIVPTPVTITCIVWPLALGGTQQDSIGAVTGTPSAHYTNQIIPCGWYSLNNTSLVRYAMSTTAKATRSPIWMLNLRTNVP